MIAINHNPSPRELRQFAGIWFPAFCGLVGGLLWYGAGWVTISIVLFIIALVVGIVGVWSPRLVRPVYLGWMYAAFPIGWTISLLMMAAIYYLLITPIGVLRRLFGRDSLQRSFDPAAKSYWVEREGSNETWRYFRQF